MSRTHSVVTCRGLCFCGPLFLSTPVSFLTVAGIANFGFATDDSQTHLVSRTCLVSLDDGNANFIVIPTSSGFANLVGFANFSGASFSTFFVMSIGTGFVTYVVTSFDAGFITCIATFFGVGSPIYIVIFCSAGANFMSTAFAATSSTIPTCFEATFATKTRILESLNDFSGILPSGQRRPPILGGL